MVGVPLLALVADEFIAEAGAEGGLDQRVGGEGLHRLLQGLGQELDAALLPLGVAQFVEIVLVGRAGIDPLAHALQARRQHQGGGEVGVDRPVGVAALAAPAPGRHPHRVGAVVRAVGVEDRRPGEARHRPLAHEALVAVHRRREGGAERPAVAQHAADEVVAGLGEAETAGIVARRTGEQVAAGLGVGERHVEMGAVAGAVGEGLGHHRRDQPLLLGVVLRHHAEEGQPVAGRERVGVLEVELELAVRILVVERVQIPAEIVDRGRDLVEPGEVVDEAAHVVAGFHEFIVRDRRVQRAVGGLAQEEDLALDAEVEAEAHGLGLLQHVLQRHAGRERVGLAPEGEVGRRPGELALPGKRDDAREVGDRGEFVLVRSLSEAVEGVAGVALGAGRHLRQVVEGDHLGLLRAVDVDIGADDVLHAFAAQIVLHGADRRIDIAGVAHGFRLLSGRRPGRRRNGGGAGSR